MTITIPTVADLFDSDLGFCRECHAEHCGVEPDAERYECTECGAREVYGAETLLFMGELEVADPEPKGPNQCPECFGSNLEKLGELGVYTYARCRACGATVGAC